MLKHSASCRAQEKRKDGKVAQTVIMDAEASNQQDMFIGSFALRITCTDCGAHAIINGTVQNETPIETRERLKV